MTSNEPDLPMTDHSVSESQSNIERSDRHTDMPPQSLSIIVSRCRPPPLHNIHRSSNQSIETMHETMLRQKSTQKRRLAKTLSMTSVNFRLSRRKILHEKCCQVNDVMCFFGLLGVFLMVLDNELTFVHVDHHDTIYTWLIKLIISISTIFLIGLVIYYHYYDIDLYCVSNCIEHWHVGLTARRISIIILEVLTCAIHPIPRQFPVGRYSEHRHNGSKPINITTTSLAPIPLTHVPVDVALGLPMFARLYLCCRFCMLHSRLVRDTSSQSLGYLNKISINFVFVIKTYFQRWPIRCLVIFCSVVFLVGSWSLRACDFNANREHITMLEAMWFFIVTFTTVGYGDVTPATYCGRSVATIVCIIGILVAALLIAVVSQKLILSRWERYVHNYVLSTELAKARAHQAVNVIIFAWKMWRLRRANKSYSVQYINVQKAFFRSIRIIKNIKQKQRTLTDTSFGLAELFTAQRDTNAIVEQSLQQMTGVKRKLDNVEKKLDDVNQTVLVLQSTLNRLLDKSTPTGSV